MAAMLLKKVPFSEMLTFTARLHLVTLIATPLMKLLGAFPSKYRIGATTIGVENGMEDEYTLRSNETFSKCTVMLRTPDDKSFEMSSTVTG